MKRTGGNVSKVARSLGLDYHGLRNRVNHRAAAEDNFRPATGPEPADIRVLGRAGKEHFVIAVKRQGGVWGPRYAEALRTARRLFDAGTHEMFQTPSNGWVVQYLIPKPKPCAPRRFFEVAA